MSHNASLLLKKIAVAEYIMRHMPDHRSSGKVTLPRLLSHAFNAHVGSATDQVNEDQKQIRNNNKPGRQQGAESCSPTFAWVPE